MRLPLLAAVLLATSGLPARAQETVAPQGDPQQRVLGYLFDSRCGDARGTDRCSSEVQRATRETFSLADAETLADQGVTLRRAMFSDTYEGYLVAITFSRVPGHAPTVEISLPHPDNGAEPRPLSAVVSERVWNRVLTSSRDFDQALERETQPRFPLFCTHHGFVIVEAVDAARLSQNVAGQHLDPAEIRRDVEVDCGDGLAANYAYSLAQVALDNLPECSSLERDERGDGRIDVHDLEFCHRLGGDRLAAADAHRSLQTLRTKAFDGLPQGDEFGWEFFAESAEHLAAPFRVAVDGGHFYFGPPHASDVDHARVEGQVIWPRPQIGEGESYEAEIKLELVRQARDFVILSYELSPKRPSRP